MAGRATLTALLSTSGIDGVLRSAANTLVFLGGYDGRVLSSTQAFGFIGGYKAPIRATTHVAFVIGSVAQVFVPTLLDSTSVIWGVASFDVVANAVKIPEHNPYRPAIPEELIGLGETFYNFAQENQAILREQHNITQAGDTTFPYQLMLDSHSSQQFTLGSIARFYHEDYGLIHARYVKFDSMIATPALCAPVGLFKSGVRLEWVVTNRLESSDPTLVVGMLAQTSLPEDSTFGWVIVDGPNLQEIRNESTGNKLGEAFSWSSTGKVSVSAPGRIIGRRIAKSVGPNLLAGYMQISLESWSIGSVVDAIEGLLTGLAADVVALQTDVDALKALTNLTATFAAIQTTLRTLTDRLAIEERARKTADTALNKAIATLAFVTPSQLGNAITQLSTALEIVRLTLTSRVTAAQTTANEALALARLIPDPRVIEGQISLILSMLAKLENRPKGKFPIVDGSVPPNLVYIADGSLVYVETY